MANTSNFKVIIAGGGPVGLTAAHALGLAGIDFVVLERREDILKDGGSILGVGASTLRVLYQLGLLDSMMSIGLEVYRMKTFDMATGYMFADTTTFNLMKTNHGILPLTFHRADFIKLRYNSLPPSTKAHKVLTGKIITDITSDDTGVLVTCADGTACAGSIIIGADGAHSQTRGFIREHALSADPKADWDAEDPFLSTYRGLWCPIPNAEGPSSSSETHGEGRSTQVVIGKHRTSILLFERLPEVTFERTRYTRRDMEEFAARFADVRVGETHRVRDVLDVEKAGMSDLAEGVLKRWYWGRMVLVGDACHKMTPNAGRGLVNGVQDVVAVANGLHGALKASPDGVLGRTTLEGLFEEY